MEASAKQNYPTFELNIKDKKRFSACNSAWPARLSPWPIFGRSVRGPRRVEGYKGGNLIRDELRKGRTVENILREKGWASVKTGNINFYYGPLLKAGLITNSEIYNQLATLHKGDLNDIPASAWYAAVLKVLEEKGYLNSAEIAYYCQPDNEIKEMLEAGKRISSPKP